MRELTILVKHGQGEEILQKAKEHKGKNLSSQVATNGDLVRVHLNNKEVSNFLESINHFKDAEITLVPRGVITLYPPYDEAPDQVTDVTNRSPIEIYLEGLQSVGSKFSLIGFSVSGGILVWIIYQYYFFTRGSHVGGTFCWSCYECCLGCSSRQSFSFKTKPYTLLPCHCLSHSNNLYLIFFYRAEIRYTHDGGC
jgi:hypothetical protein